MSSARELVTGEGVQARLHVKNGAAGMVVPEDAVQNVDGHDVLFVRTKDGFRVRPVLVGTTSVERSEQLAELLGEAGIKYQVPPCSEICRFCEVGVRIGA